MPGGSCRPFLRIALLGVSRGQSAVVRLRDLRGSRWHEETCRGSTCSGRREARTAARAATSGRRAHHTCSLLGAGNGVIGVRSRRLSIPISAIGSHRSIRRFPDTISLLQQLTEMTSRADCLDAPPRIRAPCSPKSNCTSVHHVASNPNVRFLYHTAHRAALSPSRGSRRVCCRRNVRIFRVRQYSLCICPQGEGVPTTPEGSQDGNGFCIEHLVPYFRFVRTCGAVMGYLEDSGPPRRSCPTLHDISPFWSFQVRSQQNRNIVNPYPSHYRNVVW